MFYFIFQPSLSGLSLHQAQASTASTISQHLPTSSTLSQHMATSSITQHASSASQVLRLNGDKSDMGSSSQLNQDQMKVLETLSRENAKLRGDLSEMSKKIAKVRLKSIKQDSQLSTCNEILYLGCCTRAGNDKDSHCLCLSPQTL